MRRLASYIEKHGAERGPKLYGALQREASYAGVAARIKKSELAIGPMPKPGQRAASCCDVVALASVRKTGKGYVVDAGAVRIYVYPGRRVTVFDYRIGIQEDFAATSKVKAIRKQPGRVPGRVRST